MAFVLNHYILAIPSVENNIFTTAYLSRNMADHDDGDHDAENPMWQRYPTDQPTEDTITTLYDEILHSERVDYRAPTGTIDLAGITSRIIDQHQDQNHTIPSVGQMESYDVKREELDGCLLRTVCWIVHQCDNADDSEVRHLFSKWQSIRGDAVDGLLADTRISVIRLLVYQCLRDAVLVLKYVFGIKVVQPEHSHTLDVRTGN
jgi:hypothetical protein